VAFTYFSYFLSRFLFNLTLFTCNVYINKSVLMKIELKIESWGKQNCDFDLEAILREVVILTSISENEPALNNTQCSY